jgi:hypothetical protein
MDVIKPAKSAKRLGKVTNPTQFEPRIYWRINVPGIKY